MKRSFSILVLFALMTVLSCQTRVVTPQKPIQTNSLELYKRYAIQTNDATEYKVQVLKQDSENIYGKNKKGEEVIIKKNDVREIKKFDLFSTVVVALAAVAALIFIPV